MSSSSLTRERAQYMHKGAAIDLNVNSKLLISLYGRIAQLVRALASHARGRRFESYCDHHLQHCKELSSPAFTRRVLGASGFPGSGMRELLTHRARPGRTRTAVGNELHAVHAKRNIEVPAMSGIGFVAVDGAYLLSSS